MTQVQDDGDDFEAVERASRRRSRLVMGFVVVVLSGAAAAGYIAMRNDDRRQAERGAATSWASLQHCLIGPALQPGEDLMWRVHRVEVNRDAVAANANAQSLRTHWPYRCAAHALALHTALDLLGATDAPHRRLEAAAARAHERLITGLVDTERDPHLPRTYLDDLWAAAAAVHFTAPAAITGEAAPAPAALLRRSDLVDLVHATSGGAATVAASDHTPAGGLSLLFGAATPFGCRFASGLATAHCTAVTAGAAPLVDPSFFEVDDARPGFPPLRVGEAASARAYGLDADGSDPVARPYVYRGRLDADGTASWIDSAGHPVDEAAETGRWRITRMHGATRSVAALTLPEGASRPDFAGDRVVYIAASEARHGAARIGLFGRPLVEGSEVLGHTEDLGEVQEDARIVGSCRTLGFNAVVAAAPTDVAVWIGHARHAADDSGGSSAGAHGGSHPQNVGITCGEHDATATWADDHGTTVRQIHCTTAPSAACHAVEGPGVSAMRARSPWALADLDGKVLVVWATAGGGLRMRLAPIDALAQARDVAIYDDSHHQGGLVNNLTLYVRHGAAVAEFSDQVAGDTAWHAFAIRIGSDGSVRPVTLE